MTALGNATCSDCSLRFWLFKFVLGTCTVTVILSELSLFESVDPESVLGASVVGADSTMAVDVSSLFFVHATNAITIKKMQLTFQNLFHVKNAE
tara:strand:- start:410 stop:691 length:282 start_codon:yes stop_codon:yes gene_type:complete